MKELLKSVHICQSYCKNKSGPVFSDSQCIWSEPLCDWCCTGLVTLSPYNSALCYVNGKMISEETTLKTGSRVIFGKSHVFRFTNPQQGIYIHQSWGLRPQSYDMQGKGISHVVISLSSHVFTSFRAHWFMFICLLFLSIISIICNSVTHSLLL